MSKLDKLNEAYLKCINVIVEESFLDKIIGFAKNPAEKALLQQNKETIEKIEKLPDSANIALAMDMKLDKSRFKDVKSKAEGEGFEVNHKVFKNDTEKRIQIRFDTTKANLSKLKQFISKTFGGLDGIASDFMYGEFDGMKVEDFRLVFYEEYIKSGDPL